MIRGRDQSGAPRGPRAARGFAAPSFAALAVAAGLTLGATVPADAISIFGLKLFESENDPTADIVDPVNYTVTLAVQPADADLEKALNAASTLVADKDDPVSGSLGLLAKARTDRKRLVAALYENARYDGLVTILIEGRDIATLAPDATFNTASGPVPVQIVVEPGQAFTVGRVDIRANGAPVDPQTYDLASGSSAASTRILDSEAKLLESLRNEGRPFVAVTQRDVVADSNTKTLDYRLGISPGEKVPFGDIFVDGTKAVDPGFVAYMTGIEKGGVFSPADLKKARDRLVKLDVFSSVSVKEGKAQAEDGTLPVQVEVAERKFNYFGIGGTYSNTDGAGVSGYIGNRNLFGRAESLRLDASVSRIGASLASDDTVRNTDDLDYKASLVFKKPGVLGPDSVYIGSIEAISEHPLAYDRNSIAVTSGAQYAIDDQQTVEARLRLEYETITDYLGDAEYFIASLPITYTYDSRDNKLNPTSGFVGKLYGEPSYEIEGGAPFLKARADASTYLSLTDSNRFVVAGRVSYGAVVGADLEDVPNDRRFYAGGGGSVRGYQYQTISPFFPDILGPTGDESFNDTPTGGLSLFETNLELRFGVTENIQIVPFVDGGAVGTDLAPDFSNFKIGYGIGARYLTSFGPIRVDVGFPAQPSDRDQSFQIYAGIGQAF
ncbi:autotransporter assembly complex protein TamA [Aureimonas psammosilenae]|uniref:autotransporter assembly complex protein TamA n=1 Tax=Aureimonas psammosilenae TaxID=2495496 RepID=UPI00126094ED|nr:autotransporter assembly complex family protein [Aureimonas psammosilenae]